MAHPRPAPNNDCRHSAQIVARPQPHLPANSPSVNARLLFDISVFEELEAQFDDRSTARTFVRDFADMWEERYGRLERAVLKADRDASLDAVLSLKITSTMIGARRLAERAAKIEELVQSCAMSEAAAMLPKIRKCGSQTMVELRPIYSACDDA